MTGATLMADLGAYLLVTWGNGVRMEGAGLVPQDTEDLAVLLETANEQAALQEAAR